MLLRLTARRKAISTGRRADRRHCDRRMGERVRRECAGTKPVQGGRAGMTDLARRRELLLRIMAELVAEVVAVAEVVLTHPEQPLR